MDAEGAGFVADFTTAAASWTGFATVRFFHPAVLFVFVGGSSVAVGKEFDIGKGATDYFERLLNLVDEVLDFLHSLSMTFEFRQPGRRVWILLQIWWGRRVRARRIIRRVHRQVHWWHHLIHIGHILLHIHISTHIPTVWSSIRVSTILPALSNLDTPVLNAAPGDKSINLPSNKLTLQYSKSVRVSVPTPLIMLPTIINPNRLWDCSRLSLVPSEDMRHDLPQWRTCGTIIAI